MMGGPRPMMGGMNPMMMGGMMRPQMSPDMMQAMMAGKGGMPGGMVRPQMMPQQQAAMQQMQQRPPQQQQQPQQPGMFDPNAPLTASALAAAPPAMQKQMLGSKLYPQICKYQPELAGKITGMMLEMDNSELLILLESENQLKNKVSEALRVLEQIK